MAIEIVFADNNAEYLERLTAYVKKHFEGQYTISSCVDKKQLQKRLESGKCDVLCFVPELYDGKMDFKQILAPIILVDEEEETPYPDRFKYTVNKYTRISKMLSYINEVYEVAKKNKPLVYGVYGPAGGVGTSTVAVAVALSYVNAERKTCYLNLEDISSMSLFFEEKNSETLVEIQRGEEITCETLLNQYMRSDIKSGIVYCTDIKVLLNQAQMSITELIDKIIAGEMATAIVIDLGSSLSSVQKELFEYVDKLLVVTTDANYATCKFNKFMNGVQDKENIEVVYNQSNTAIAQEQVVMAGRIDKLYAKQAIGVCEYIAQNDLIKVVGI